MRKLKRQAETGVMLESKAGPSCPIGMRQPEPPQIERRQTPRTSLYGGSFAVLYSEDGPGESEAFAQILDISNRGLAFRFFAGTFRASQVKRIDISLPSMGIVLHDLPVRAVGEAIVATSGRRPNAGSEICRLGMRFNRLPHNNARALEDLIERFACGRAS